MCILGVSGKMTGSPRRGAYTGLNTGVAIGHSVDGIRLSPYPTSSSIRMIVKVP
jgi:hypothetical protein